MQDRYAGDIGDYGKIALLKAIWAHGLSIGVNWYRAEALDAEKKKDGTFRRADGKYLIPDELKQCDVSLADRLTEIALSKRRSVDAIEEANFIPGAIYYHETILSEKRAEWHKYALEVLKDADVVFLDPDNGLLVKSVGKRSVRSIKYAFYEEVKDYIEQGQSVLVYNHRCRKREPEYFYDICAKLQKDINVSETEILKITFPKCSVKDYFAIHASKDHGEKIGAAFLEMEEGIWGQLGMCRIPFGVSVRSGNQGGDYSDKNSLRFVDLEIFFNIVKNA